MKQKFKLNKKKSFHNHNPLVNYAPALENLQINSLKTRKGNLASTGNVFLAINHVLIIFCVIYLLYSLIEISNYIIICEIYCFFSAFHLVSCLLYILAASSLIIAIKQRRIEYYRKFYVFITLIILLQTIKQLGYFFFFGKLRRSFLY